MTLTPDQIATISAVASIIIPPVVSLLKREQWPTWVKQLIAMTAAVVAAVIGIAVTVTDWSAINVATLIGLAYLGSQVVYQAYFRGSASDTKLTTLPSKTATPAEPVVDPAKAA